MAGSYIHKPGNTGRMNMFHFLCILCVQEGVCELFGRMKEPFFRLILPTACKKYNKFFSIIYNIIYTSYKNSFKVISSTENLLLYYNFCFPLSTFRFSEVNR